MSAPTGNILIDLRQFHLLDPAQFDELTRTISSLPHEPKALAQELMRRGWLTPYQVNRLLSGRGRELLLGSYILLERLGEGGMGAVFKARNWKLGALRALKIIRKDRTAHPTAVQRFQREMRAAAQLSHPNVVHAHDADEVDGTHLIAMELLSGVDLARRVREGGPLPVEQACEYVRQAALGLQHAHERGLVHRDVKPSNLQLTSNNVVKVLDLGLARLAPSPEDEASATLTQNDTLTGTPDYMAPEQARQSHTVDARADLYSLGATMYFLLTGRPPFPDRPMTAKIAALLFEEPQPVEALRPETPPAVASVVRKLMAKDPARRCQTAGELAAVLEVMLKGEGAGDPTVAPAPVPAPAVADAETISGLGTDPGTCPPAPPKPARRRRRLAPLVAAGVVLTTAVAGLVWFLATAASAPKAEPPPAPGKLVVRSADPDLRILVHRAGRREPDEAKVNETLELPPDDYELKFTDAAPPGLRLSKRTIAIRSGESETVRVDGFPLSGDALVSRPAWIDGAKTWTIETRDPRILLSPLALSPDGRRLAGAAPDGAIRILDGRTGEPIRTLTGHAGKVTALAWSPDADRPILASAGADRAVRLWDSTSGAWSVVQVLGASLLAWSPDGQILALAVDQDVYLWYVAGRRLLVLPRVHSLPARALAWSPDGQVLASADASAIHLWRPPDAKHADWTDDRRLGHTGAINGLAWSPDGSTLASAGADGTVRLWNRDDPVKPGRMLTAWKGAIGAVAWPPSGDETVASIGDDGNLRFWDAATREPRRIVPRGWPQGSFSADGGLIVAAGGPWTARLWETATGRPLGTLVLLPKGAVVLSEDGHYRCYPDAPGSDKPIEDQLLYVVQTEKGQVKYTVDQFAAKAHWKNDPGKARLDSR